MNSSKFLGIDITNNPTWSPLFILSFTPATCWNLLLVKEQTMCVCQSIIRSQRTKWYFFHRELRATSSHGCPFLFISFLSALFTRSLTILSPSILTTPFSSLLSPSTRNILLLFCAAVLFLISPFIKDYKYIPCLWYFWMLVLFLLSAFWRPLTILFCSI